MSCKFYYFIDEGGTVSTKFSLVSGGVGAQARQALENMKAIVESSGSGLHNVVSLLFTILRFPIF